ncbi:uncharacterized protein LOC125178897 isoform X1 [Hyalella azteca]|uniref:Uncharacterized protein LOC125178897 isoform X1 n=1 Tax=Hyalella azteca TaxID=294128 RepID=A0A979FRC7_HYAAZ|nr:uncharacterized protein LOC125178897 isoform X1 [Hyalella azteca]
MKSNKYPSRVFLLHLILLGCTAGSQVTTLFSKVRGNVVEYQCRLATRVPASTTFLGLHSACSLMCQQTEDCRFFCTLESTGACALFKAFVAVRWQGHPTSGTSTTYDACYTSWGDPRDIVKTNSPFTFSSNSLAFPQRYATDGYACLVPYSIFATNLETNSYSQIDLEQISRVQAVIVATSEITYIKDMDVLLSNTSDFTLGQKIGRVNGYTPYWSTYTINTNTSVAGRYITFYTAQYSIHGYADIQVIPLL